MASESNLQSLDLASAMLEPQLQTIGFAISLTRLKVSWERQWSPYKASPKIKSLEIKDEQDSSLLGFRGIRIGTCSRFGRLSWTSITAFSDISEPLLRFNLSNKRFIQVAIGAKARIETI